jgi:uncharacterized protein (DUF488 family)
MKERGMIIYTIGFTQTSAESFFTRLTRSGAQRIIDVRRTNVSQLAGFAKRDDLRFFVRTICAMDYVHVPELSPTREILDAYRRTGDWGEYERAFLGLMRAREIEKTIAPALIGDGCLLCSERTPDRCHRRLVADYLASHWGDITIVHL